MIATVASSSSQYHHTINTLKYADRVGNNTQKASQLSCMQSITVNYLAALHSISLPPSQLLPAQHTPWAPFNMDALCSSHLTGPIGCLSLAAVPSCCPFPHCEEMKP